jgi:recombination protein RecA
VLCSSIGSPYKTCDSWIRFGQGIDKVQEILMIAIDLGLISVAGSWYNLDFVESEKVKVQGQEKVYNYLTEHKELYTLLESKVKEMLY